MSQTFAKKEIKPSDFGITILRRDVPRLSLVPIVNAQCQKCDGDKAKTWGSTVGSNGIKSIKFYRCVSCGHTWRETD